MKTGLSLRHASTKLPISYISVVAIEDGGVRNADPEEKRLEPGGFFGGRNCCKVWFIFGFCPLIGRIIAMEQTATRSIQPFCFGVIQDFIIIYQLLVFMCYWRFLFGPSNSFAFDMSLFSSLTLLSTLPSLIDILLQLHHHPRLNLSFVLMVFNNGNQFLSSSSEVYSYLTFGIILLWLSIALTGAYGIAQGSIILYGFGKQLYYSKRRVVLLSSISFLIWMTSVGFLQFQSPATAYLFTNSLFTLEYEVLTSFGGTSQTPVHIPLHFFPFTNEEYVPLSTTDDFPLYRRTKKYKGNRLFQLDLKENERPNIILIMMEAWRAANVGVLGGQSQLPISATPYFDALSQQGILFEHHYTPCIQTTRTMMSTLFGVLPWFHVASAIPSFNTALSLKGLPQYLKGKGYFNAFVSATDFNWDGWDHFLQANGFDELVDAKAMEKLLEEKDNWHVDEKTSWGLHDRDGFQALYEKVTEYAQQKNPFFIDFYSISSHHPWNLPSTYQRPNFPNDFTTRNTIDYVHSLKYSDEQLGLFIEKMRNNGLMKNTIVLIQGDHGMGRFEHGNNPGVVESRVWDEGTHTPMLILADTHLDDKDKGKRISQITSQLDTMATVADVLGGDLEQHGIGESMMREHLNRSILLANPFQGGTIGIRQQEIKIVSSMKNEVDVYDLEKDPNEQHPQTAQQYPTRPILSLFYKGQQTIAFFNSFYENNQFCPKSSEGKS